MGQVVTKVACTEYQVAWLYSDGIARSFVFNSKSGHVEITGFKIGGRKAVDISTGFNRITILDDQGYIWLTDGGQATATRWNKDATGAAFNGNVSIYGYFYTYLSIRTDGSIWYWGGDDYKFYGGNAINVPMRLPQPAGVKFVKLATGNSLLGLTSTGDVYEWDKGSTRYTKVNLPRPASDIAASHMAFNVAVIPDNIAASTMGYPYAWGSESPYWGGDGTNYPLTNPQALKTMWKMPAPIKKITANQNVIHFIDANGDLYGIGDNPNGEIGNGEELVNHAEKYPTPYAWSWIKYEMLTGAPPIHVSPGTKFKDIFTGNTFAFYHYALDVNDKLYFWGRNKSFVGGDGAVNNQEADYPNAMDVLTPSLRDPLKVKPTETVGYNFKKYTLKGTPKQKVAIGGVAVLSATATPTTLSAGGKKNYGYSITKYKWSKVSGPSAHSITLPGSLITPVTGLENGTYVFAIQTTDNNTGTITAYDTVVVGSGVGLDEVAVNAGADISITQPASSVTLTGAAQGGSGGGSTSGSSISSYQWSQVSGPSNATFANSKAAQTMASGLVVGTYVFKLTVANKSGQTGSDQVTVTVNQVTGSFAVNAGPDQTVTLPTNNIKLTGVVATITGGQALSLCKWTQVSGPSNAVITNGGTFAPTFGGLVQGSYVFKVTLLSVLGLSVSDQVTVTVKSSPSPALTVYAGEDQTITLPVSRLDLTPYVQVSNSTIKSYLWTQVSGPSSAFFANSRSAQTAVTGLKAGAYVFKLTVTGSTGLTASDQVTVTVKPGAAPTITVYAGADQTITWPSRSLLDGYVEATNSSVKSYQWLQISGPSIAYFLNSKTAQTQAVGLVAGTYVFRLTATGSTGLTASDQLSVTVKPGTPPTLTVDAGDDQTIVLPARGLLTGAGKSTNNAITGYQWTQVSGPSTAFFANSKATQTEISGLKAGKYVFKLTATGSADLTASDMVTVTAKTATAARSMVSGEASALSLGDSVADRSLLLYPNPVPADQQLAVEGQGWNAGTVKFMIYDLGGRLVKQVVLENQFSYFRQYIPAAGLTKGTYMLSIQAEGQKPRTLRFVVQ